MTAYVALFVWLGPWLGSEHTAHRNVPEIAVAALLAFLATLGSRSARMLMILYSIAGVFALFFGSAQWAPSHPLGLPLLVLAGFLAQIGLLVSTPIYARTRPHRSPGQSYDDPLLPWPKLRSVLVSAAGGLVLALVPFSDGSRETICAAGAGNPASPCEAAGFGYPIAYRYSWNDLAPRGISVAAFVTDWALWGMIILLVLYLLQVAGTRETASIGPSRGLQGPATTTKP